MDKITVILALAYFALIGWAVHEVMGNGNHGSGLLHFTFVGGLGCGLGALLEYVTQLYTSTVIDAIVLSFICACAVELIIRKIKQTHR